MNKYQEALDSFEETFRNATLDDDLTNERQDLLQELVDKATPKKPATVMLFGEEVPTCPADRCGVGLNPDESIWHKSSYCGNCGQAIDWSEHDISRKA